MRALPSDHPGSGVDRDAKCGDRPTIAKVDADASPKARSIPGVLSLSTLLVFQSG